MFTAYFDASGTPDDGHVLTVAGYVSDVKKWARFETVWRSILDREGVESFHMTDFASSKGQFKTWFGQVERRKLFIQDLGTCARKFTNKRFGNTIVLADYWKVDKQYQLHETIGYPYAACGRLCIALVKQWAAKHKIKQVAFLFEDGDKHKGDLQRACREEGITPVFGSKDGFLPFQAADFAAWKTMYPIRHIVNSTGLTEEEWARLMEDSITGFSSEPSAGGVLDHGGLLGICGQASIPLR